MPTPRHLITLLLVLLLVPPARAHIGTAGIFVQGNAGPYPVYISVTPPTVIPGQARVSVVSADPRVTSVSIQTNILTADPAATMPQATPLDPGPPTTHEFHGTGWVMTQGSWQIRVVVQGSAGPGSLAVPLPASPTTVMHMSRPFGALLIVLGLVLIAALASLAAALVREAQLDPGDDKPTPARTRASYRAAALAVFGVVLVLTFGNYLWRQEIHRYTANVYQPLSMQATVTGGTLHLQLTSPNAVQDLLGSRRLDDLVLDHNHLMHLYLVRWPAMDIAYHLHPTQQSAGRFDLPLPAIPSGHYRLFADIVHADGFPETASTELTLNQTTGIPLLGDDARGDLPPSPGLDTTTDTLPDGYTFHFAVATPGHPATAAAAGTLRANQPVILSFTLLDPAGHPPADMHNYMGMLGHAAIIADSGKVFAHIHPEGSVAMTAYMMANAGQGSTSMSGMTEDAAGPLPNTAAFPFGFPEPGPYRVLIQMKHGQTVETGAVDLTVR